MNASQLSGRLIVLIAVQMDVTSDRVTPSARLAEDLGMDSLDKVELGIALEESFGFETGDEYPEDTWQTVGDVERWLSGLVEVTP